MILGFSLGSLIPRYSSSGLLPWSFQTKDLHEYYPHHACWISHQSYPCFYGSDDTNIRWRLQAMKLFIMYPEITFSKEIVGALWNPPKILNMAEEVPRSNWDRRIINHALLSVSSISLLYPISLTYKGMMLLPSLVLALCPDAPLMYWGVRAGEKDRCQQIIIY
jgi:hypothetical protein